MHLGLTTSALSPTLRLALTTGALGGFTTYSTFNYETIELMRSGAYAMAGLNVAATLILCLLGGMLGVAGARFLAGS
jgi:CrcB protein